MSLQELDCRKRRGSRGARIFRAGLTAQPWAEHVGDPIQFLGDEGTESPREVSFADGLMDCICWRWKAPGFSNGLGMFNSQRLPLVLHRANLTSSPCVV